MSTDPIDEAVLLQARDIASGMGAVVYFLGVVRPEEAGQSIAALDYEAFVPMAEHQFNLIFDAIAQRWPVDSIRLIHRIGRVFAGEASLWVEVTSPHRGEAFAACQYLVEEMKQRVPIWKKPIGWG